MTNAIEEKLAKILALAERGVGGEKTNAKNILEKLLKKHRLTLDDIVNNSTQELTRKEYKYKTATERTLLIQIFVSITNDNHGPYWSRRGTRIIAFDLTVIDHVELKEMYKYYNKLLKEEMSCIVKAFIWKHELHSNQKDKNSSSDKKGNRDNMLRVQGMMSNMKKSDFISTRKRIEAQKSAKSNKSA